jgi:hypothetical protein
MPEEHEIPAPVTMRMRFERTTAVARACMLDCGAWSVASARRGMERVMRASRTVLVGVWVGGRGAGAGHVRAFQESEIRKRAPGGASFPPLAWYTLLTASLIVSLVELYDHTRLSRSLSLHQPTRPTQSLDSSHHPPAHRQPPPFPFFSDCTWILGESPYSAMVVLERSTHFSHHPTSCSLIFRTPDRPCCPG